MTTSETNPTLAFYTTDTLRRLRSELEPVVTEYEAINVEIRRREASDAVTASTADRKSIKGWEEVG